MFAVLPSFIFVIIVATYIGAHHALKPKKTLNLFYWAELLFIYLLLLIFFGILSHTFLLFTWFE